MSKLIHRSKKLYWSLIVTFTALYLAVAFVSTLHAITFFQLANTLGLAILLGSAYEIGQAAVLFSILMTENRNRLLAWLMMFLLTALQITANVYASFKFIDSSGSNDWTYWQRAILFGVQADNQEMYKVIISWISGALLPLVALGMTALVADNIRLAQGEKLGEDNEEISSDRIEEIIENEVQKRLNEKNSELNNNSDELFELLPDNISDKKDLNYSKPEENDLLIEEENIPINNIKDNLEENKKDTNQNEKYRQEPVNKMRGWNLMTEYVDDDHNVFSKGAFIKNDPQKIPTSKKVSGRA